MQKREKFMDDIARLAGGTAGVVSGISQNLRAEIKSRVDEVVDRLDLVPRKDLERLETIMQETRKQQQTLELRIEALEKPKKKKSS